MVLKRILVTTLSALGLGALAASTASGQTAGDGNIPAPDIFDDQITCSMLVPSMTLTPTVVPKGEKKSPLDVAIGEMGADGWRPVTDSDTLGLGYVIPPEGMNCGVGATGGPTLGTMNFDGNSDGDFVDVGDTLAWGDVPKDVADGYTALLDLYKDVHGDPVGTTGGTARALQTAQKNLNDAIAAGTSGAALTPLQDAVTRTQEAHNKATAAFTGGSAGPIYQAGVAEWMAKAAVSQAVVDYNKRATATNTAQTALDGLSYDKYVPLGNAELVTAVVTFDDDGMATIVGSALEQYANADPSMVDANSGMVDAMGETTTTGGNFTTTGELIVPMSLQDHDNNNETDTVLRPVVETDTTRRTIGGDEGIRRRVMQVNAAAEALEKLRDDNVNPTLQALYNEAARRARAEADYYNAEWAEVLSDTTNKNTVTEDNPATENVDESAPFSIASRNAELQTEMNKRSTAEQTLRAAVAAREGATSHVRNQFSNAQSFYEQLIARRQALKVTADRAVTSASTSGTAPKNLVDAATAAQKALDDAQKAKDELDALFEDEDDPTVALITELLKTNGDDGQALVDAISATYDTAAGAADAAREIVDGLTGEGGAVSANTADIKENSEAIATNAEGIATNAEGIATNAEGIATNAEGIATNAEGIATNAEGIATNAEGIMANSGRIDTNAGNIMTNAGNIMTNADNIMANSGRIDSNADSIMTNAGNIMTNADNIMANSGRIDSNADAIAANMNSIGSNSSAISDNRNMIGELSEDLETVRAGVAASMALAGMPAINGRGISIGVGSFDGESAFAVGFQIQGEAASFKVGVTSASGATGASAGVGFQF